MLILAIDPGAETGWALYDSEGKRVVDCGTFDGWHCGDMANAMDRNNVDSIVIESVVPAHGGIYPQTVEAALIQGHLEEFIECRLVQAPQRMTRGDIRKTLSTAVHRDPVVVNDKTAWQALTILHGAGSDKRTTKKGGPGGCIGDVMSHERAALAAAVAWAIANGHWKAN